MVDSYQNDNVTDIVQIRTKAANLALVIPRHNIGKMHIYVILALNRTRMRHPHIMSGIIKRGLTMNRLFNVAALTLCIIFLVSCTPNYTKSEKPIETIPVLVDVSDILNHAIGNRNAIPISHDEIVYTVNGWNDNYDTEITASIYDISLGSNSNRLFSISDFHIKQVYPFMDTYLLVLKDNYGKHNTGITLLCVDKVWKEKWSYPIDDGLVGLIICEGFILIKTYSLTEQDVPHKVTVLYENGESNTSKFLIDNEMILYAKSMEDKQSLYTVVRESRSLSSRCLLKSFDRSFKLEFEIELPFRPDDESVVSIVSVAGSEYLLTNRKIYEINNGKVSEIASAAKNLNISYAKGEHLWSIPFSKFSESDLYLVGELSKGSFHGIIGCYHNSDFSEIEVRSYGLIKNLLCAYIDEEGYLVMVTEEDIGKLNLIKWEQ